MQALIAPSESQADSSTQESSENEDRGDGGNYGPENETQVENYTGDVIANVYHDHPLMSDGTNSSDTGARISREPDCIDPQLLFSLDQYRPLSPDLNAPVMPMLITPAAPSESLHDLGMSYFLANYVLQGSGPCPGFLNYTMDILDDPLCDKEMVQVAIRATGLAGLASTNGAYNVMCKARYCYAEAIKRVNAALVDPHMIKNDSTIFAVMILGLFETITCSSNESLDAWKHHLNGVASLLIHRGTAQFCTKHGLQMFGEASSHVLTLCSKYNYPVPPRLRFLRVELERDFTRKTPSWTLSSAHIQVMDLYHHVDPDQEIPFLLVEWEKLLSRATELDVRLDNLVAELPVHWLFKTVKDPGANPRLVYDNTYHIYYNTWVAKVWDGIRGCRILLHQVIYCLLTREGLAWAPYELTPHEGIYAALLQRVVDTTTEMRDGIFASVPQMLGYADCGSVVTTQPVPASGAYFLLWYLFLAGSLPINTPEIRAWATDRLYAIRSSTGIQKAGYLANILKTNSAYLDANLVVNRFLFLDF